MPQISEKITLSRVSVRFDDYHETSDHRKWYDLVKYCTDMKINVFIGVIPFNTDEQILNNGNYQDFLKNLKDFQDNPHVKLMLHGYNHAITSGNCFWGLSKRGEFFVDDEETTKAKVDAAVKFFSDNSIELTGYFAPAHGYSKILIDLIRESYPHWWVADCYYSRPVIKNNLIIIPQIFNKFTNLDRYFGISLYCFHPERWKSIDVSKFQRRLARRIKNNELVIYEVKDQTNKDLFIDWFFKATKQCKRYLFR